MMEFKYNRLDCKSARVLSSLVVELVQRQEIIYYRRRGLIKTGAQDTRFAGFAQPNFVLFLRLLIASNATERLNFDDPTVHPISRVVDQNSNLIGRHR